MQKRTIKITILIVILLFPLLVSADEQYGRVDNDGRIRLYDDENGSYQHGRVDNDGRIRLYDEDGNYQHGRVGDDGRIRLYDD